MAKENHYINISAARVNDQRKIMKKILKEGHCPFCRENLKKYHHKPIIKEGKFWILTENQWPYEKTKHQLLAIYNDHIEHISDINPEAGKELIELFSTETKKRSIPGGGIAIRFGKNNKYGNYGSSVLHLHAHLIEPDLQNLKDTESWKFKFGKPINQPQKEG